MKKYIFSVLLLLYLVPYYFIEKEGSALGLKKLISVENKKVIKKYIFPYKFISEQENVIQQFNGFWCWKQIRSCSFWKQSLELGFCPSGVTCSPNLLAIFKMRTPT